MHRFLADPAIAEFENLLGRSAVKANIAHLLDAARGDGGAPSYDTLRAAVLERLEQSAAHTLARVINATGILLHTNLGRAPLAAEAIDAMGDIAGGYSNLEYDLSTGGRGSRYEHATGLLRDLTGAQDALVVNNCAAAVLLVLDTFATGREVIVARNQLIEIGGGFRLPDVLARSGAILIEAGATNKVYLHDFERALSPRTALIMRSHPSNYRISGFTQDVEPGELAALAHRAGIPAVEDLGSGALVDLEQYRVPHERTAREAVADGFDLVAFSGDKLLGGPQAGILIGSAQLVARLRANPLLRALRVDKLTLAALSETLRLYASGERDRIPVYAMLKASPDDLLARAKRYTAELPAEIIQTKAFLGAGSLPEDSLPSVGLAFRPQAGVDVAAARLRGATPPVIARIEADRLIFDLRTVLPEEDDRAIAALRAIS